MYIYGIVEICRNLKNVLNDVLQRAPATSQIYTDNRDFFLRVQFLNFSYSL